MQKDIRRSVEMHRPTVLGGDALGKFAVFLPLLKDKTDKYHLLFEVRSKNLKGQPGEICFPGGGVEEQDKNYQETAVRETSEELGITAAAVEVWGKLDVLIKPTKMIIYPFVGKLNNFEEIVPNENEVEEVFTVPLEYLLNSKPDYYEVILKPEPPEDFPFEKIPGGKNYSWQQGIQPEYFYEYCGRTIWGTTARILTNFLAVIQEVHL